MIDKIKVICIKIGNFKHHGKLEVGKIYLNTEVYRKMGVSIYNTEDNKFTK